MVATSELNIVANLKIMLISFIWALKISITPKQKLDTLKLMESARDFTEQCKMSVITFCLEKSSTAS
jgi:3-dehydroquinate dehydratase